MEELENKIDKIKLKSETDEEKIDNKKLRYMKMRDKKEEKKNIKQNNKNMNSNKNKNKSTNENINKKKNIDITNDNNNNNDSNNSDNNNDNNINNDNNDNINNDNNKKTNDKQVFYPVIIDYCEICGMPYEYCEYGKFYNECKETNKEKYNYDTGNNTNINDNKNNNNSSVNNKKQATKSQKNAISKITIQKTTRARKKVVTVVVGLHAYTKLEKMAKTFSRFYACGSSVIKGVNNNQDQIDIQGDVEHNIAEVIMKNCPEVTEDLFVFLPPK